MFNHFEAAVQSMMYAAAALVWLGVVYAARWIYLNWGDRSSASDWLDRRPPDVVRVDLELSGGATVHVRDEEQWE